MSQQADRVGTHGVWETMRIAGVAIDNAVQRPGATVTEVADLERLREVLTFIGKRLEGANRELIPLSALAAIGDPFTNTKISLDAYVADGNPAHIQNCMGYADNALIAASQVPVIVASRDAKVMSAAATDYRNDLVSLLEGARKVGAQAAIELEALKARLTELTGEATTQRTNLQNLAAEWQKQFTEAQGARNTEYTANETARQTEYTTNSAQRNDAFVTLIDQYRTALGQHRLDADKLHAEAAQMYADDSLELRKKYNDEATEILASVTTTKKNVETVAQLIAEVGLSNGYMKTADKARSRMHLWQLVTVASFVGVALFAYKIFAIPIDPAIVWQTIVGRVAVTILAGFCIAYCAKQSDKFFEADRRNRKHALELGALELFIAPLGDAERAKFRMDVGERTFGRDEAFGPRGEPSPASLLQHISEKQWKQILEFVADLVKRK